MKILNLLVLCTIFAVALEPESVSRERSLIPIMRLTGVGNPEELDEETVEQLSAYLENPLKLNIVSRSRLIASGLFTQYQVATLIDYREKYGDILSLTELSLIDGFTKEKSEILSPFISLEAYAAAGRSSLYKGRIDNSLTIRANEKITAGESQSSYGLKYMLRMYDIFEFGAAGNKAYNDKTAIPKNGSAYAAIYGKKKLGKIIVGDYNLRYGQGIALWSGFNTSGYSYPKTFTKRPSGISPCRSFNGGQSYRGIAGDFNSGKLTFSASVGIDGLREIITDKKSDGISLSPSINAGWIGRNIQASFTCSAKTSPISKESDKVHFRNIVCSGDFRTCIKGVDLFGELAINLLSLNPLGIIGTSFRAIENLELGFCGRYLEKEHGFVGGGRFSAGKRISLQGQEGFGSAVSRHSGTFSIDVAYFPFPKYGAEGESGQLKMQLDYQCQISHSVAATLRFSERIRTEGETDRTEIRTDLKYSTGRWMAAMRLNGVYNKSLGMLAYIEGGHACKIITLYARAGLFRIDYWQDRIYVYERDAPGNFNVPAYYGRGCWEAVTINFKAAKWCRLYLRASSTQYPWKNDHIKSTRYARTEIKFQAVFTL